MAIIIKAVSDVGLVRENNEDSYFFDGVNGASGCVLAMVSDGVGGKQHGEVASEITRFTFEHLNSESKLSITQDPSMRAPMLDMCARRAHQDIANASKDKQSWSGMACTLVACIADAAKAGWVNVGDSRIYHFSRGQLSQISEDQTVARALLKEGRISEQQLATHPDKNTLMFCLGVESIHAPIEPQSGEFAWAKGDKILLCTDGLTDMVNEGAIFEILGSKSSDEALLALKEAAFEAGGRDNITAIVMENQ